MEKPTARKDIDLTELYAACKRYIDYIESNEYHFDENEDYQAEIAFTALEAIYGDEFFDFLEKREEEREAEGWA